MVFIRTDMEEYRMKFTKAAALIMSLSIVGVSVAACNNEPEPVSSDVNVISTQQQNSGNGSPAGTVDAQAESENYVFVYNGVNLIVNAEIDETKFSEDDYEVYEVESCAGQGMTSEYVFKGGSVQVETFTGSSVISRIALCDDTVTTAEGIYIGQTIDDVKAKYGEPTTTTEVMYTYVKGSSDLRFYFDGDGKITQIQYFATGI